jgi:hypothetical protein
MDTGQYSEDQFIAMGIGNLLKALQMTLRKSYKKPVKGGLELHQIFERGRFQVHVTTRFSEEEINQSTTERR